MESVIIADIDFRSEATLGPEGGIIRTASIVRFRGRSALMTAGEVPGGNEDNRRVGLATTGSVDLCPGLLSSSSSDVLNAFKGVVLLS